MSQISNTILDTNPMTFQCRSIQLLSIIHTPRVSCSLDKTNEQMCCRPIGKLGMIWFGSMSVFSSTNFPQTGLPVGVSS